MMLYVQKKQNVILKLITAPASAFSATGTCEDMILTKEQTSAIKKLSKLRAGALLSLSNGLPELFAGQEFSKSWSVD